MGPIFLTFSGIILTQFIKTTLPLILFSQNKKNPYILSRQRMNSENFRIIYLYIQYINIIIVVLSQSMLEWASLVNKIWPLPACITFVLRLTCNHIVLCTGSRTDLWNPHRHNHKVHIPVHWQSSNGSQYTYYNRIPLH